MKNPQVASVVLYHPPVAEQHGGHRAMPGLVQQVHTTAGSVRLDLTVFGGDGGAFIASRVASEPEWKAGGASDAVARWTWPEIAA